MLKCLGKRQQVYQELSDYNWDVAPKAVWQVSFGAVQAFNQNDGIKVVLFESVVFLGHSAGDLSYSSRDQGVCMSRDGRCGPLPP